MKIERIFLEIEGQKKMELKTALIGGTLAAETEGEENPTGMFAGKLDLGDMGIALLHSLRTVIRIQREYHKMPLDTSIDYIKFTLEEAIRREVLDKDSVIERFKKMS